MVVLSHTVAHPGAVMVKCGHTLVTHRAVLGPQGFLHQTGPAKLTGLQRILYVSGIT